MVTTINNFWVFFHYGVNREHDENLLSSDISWDYLLLIASIILLPLTLGIQKNIHIHDEVYYR